MNPRKVLTATLLGFVVLSLGYLTVRSLRAAREWQNSGGAQAATVTASARTEGPAEQEKVIAYYFHVTVRCTTCRAIESYSKEVIHSRFAKDLETGRLEWRLVNLQSQENRHFVQDYQLFTKSLVLVRIKGGQEKEFKVLNDTWELVGDKTAMQRYVENEVRGFLRKIG